MTAVSPGGRIAGKDPSDIDVSPLNHSRNIHALSTLSEIFQSTYGSRGRAKNTHNACGGHVTHTTSCGRLLQSLSLSVPVVKLIQSALQDHLRVYGDGGSLTAILALQLILKALELPVHKRLFIEVYNLILRVCEQYLQSDHCPCKIGIDFSSREQMIKLVRGLYTSKPCCLLFNDDLNHMCQLTIEGFLQTFPTKSNALNMNNGNLLYMTLEGTPVQESKLYNGILFQTPQIPIHHQGLIDIKHSEDGILLAMVETSMAGDADSFLDVNYEMNSEVRLSDNVLHHMEQFVEELVNAGVGFLACQRVIHPKIKKLLKQKKIFILDRLGKVHFTALHQIAGGQIFHPFTPVSAGGAIGHLQQVAHLVVQKKSYVQLMGYQDSNSVCTLLLCNRSSEALAEMKEVCESAQCVLRQTARRPEVLCGGGCWQTSLGHHLRVQLPSVVKDWADLLGCPETQLGQIFKMVSSVMELPSLLLARTKHTVQVTDRMNRMTGHSFQLPVLNENSKPVSCQCGAVSYNSISEMSYEILNKERSLCITGAEIQNEVDLTKCDIIDSYSPALGAVRDAFGISSMILGIHNYIQDVN